MDKDKLEELKDQTKVDNSRLEAILEKEITPEMEHELFEALKEAQLFLPVSPSPNMFEGIENAKPGDVFETKGQAGFDINYLTDPDGNKAVPLFTSDDVMKEAGMISSVMVMFASDLVDMLKQSERYAVIAINPFTEHGINMPFEAFINMFNQPTEKEKEFYESLNELLEVLSNHSYELEDDRAFMLRHDENVMKDNSVDGLFIPNIPMQISTNPNFRKELKYANILLFDRGKKVLPLTGVGEDEFNTIVAPGTEFRIVEELDEFTTVWKCGAQPFYDESK